jgi:hypothetical protein
VGFVLVKNQLQALTELFEKDGKYRPFTYYIMTFFCVNLLRNITVIIQIAPIFGTCYAISGGLF